MMKSKFFQGLPFIISCFGVAISYVIKNPLTFHLCSRTYEFNNYAGCLDHSIKYIGVPLLGLFLLALPTTAALFLIRKEVFYAWLKTMAWFIPLVALEVFVISKPPDFPDVLYQPIDREQLGISMGILLAIVTLIVIAWKYWRLNRQERTQKTKVQ